MDKKTLNRLGIILIILLGIASIYLIITSHLNSNDSNSSFQSHTTKQTQATQQTIL